MNTIFYLTAIILIISMIFVEIGRRKKGVDIFVAPIKGVMFGALYNVDVYEYKKELNEEHYMQVALYFISLNIIWVKKIG
jgi:hypothetical protein